MGRRWFGIGGESDWLRGPSQRWRHGFSLAGEDIHTGGTFDRRRSRVRRYGHVTRGAGSSGQGSEAQFDGALRAVHDVSAGLQARGREMERKAFVSLLPLVCGLIVFPIQDHAAESEDLHPATLVEWASGESAERLSRSSHKTDFFALSNHFISQDNSIFCHRSGLVGHRIERIAAGQKGGTAVGPAVYRGGRDGLAPAGG